MLRMHQELFEVAGTLDGTRNFSLKTSFCSVVWQRVSGILHLTGFRRSVQILLGGGLLQRPTTSSGCFLILQLFLSVNQG